MPLKPSMGIKAYIKDFQKSDAPQFKGKSKEQRRDQAVAAYLQAKDDMKEGTVKRVTQVSLDQAKRDLKMKKIQKKMKSLDEISVTKRNKYYDDAKTDIERAKSSAVGKILRGKEADGTRHDHSIELRRIKRREKGIKTAKNQAIKNIRGELYKKKTEAMDPMMLGRMQAQASATQRMNQRKRDEEEADKMKKKMMTPSDKNKLLKIRQMLDKEKKATNESINFIGAPGLGGPSTGPYGTKRTRKSKLRDIDDTASAHILKGVHGEKKAKKIMQARRIRTKAGLTHHGSTAAALKHHKKRGQAFKDAIVPPKRGMLTKMKDKLLNRAHPLFRDMEEMTMGQGMMVKKVPAGDPAPQGFKLKKLAKIHGGKFDVYHKETDKVKDAKAGRTMYNDTTTKESNRMNKKTDEGYIKSDKIHPHPQANLTKVQRRALTALDKRAKKPVTLPGMDMLKKKEKEPTKVGRQSQVVRYEEKGRGPTGIAYSLPKGHPDAENPATRKKYPERQTAKYKKDFAKNSPIKLSGKFSTNENAVNEISSDAVKKYLDKAMPYYRRNTPRPYETRAQKPETIDKMRKRHKGIGSALNRQAARGEVAMSLGSPSVRKDEVKRSTMRGKLPHELPKAYQKEQAGEGRITRGDVAKEYHKNRYLNMDKHMHPEDRRDPAKNQNGHDEIASYHMSKSNDKNLTKALNHKQAAAAHYDAAHAVSKKNDKIDQKLSFKAHKLSAKANNGDMYKHLEMTSRTGSAHTHPLVRHSEVAHGERRGSTLTHDSMKHMVNNESVNEVPTTKESTWYMPTSREMVVLRNMMKRPIILGENAENAIDNIPIGSDNLHRIFVAEAKKDPNTDARTMIENWLSDRLKHGDEEAEYLGIRLGLLEGYEADVSKFMNKHDIDHHWSGGKLHVDQKDEKRAMKKLSKKYGGYGPRGAKMMPQVHVKK